MPAMTNFDLDDTGKIDLGEVYDQPDPRAYYQTLVNLDYQIPSAAAPVIRKVIDARRKARDQQKATLLDVGCSYGVNSAILRHRIALSDLFRLYSRDVTKNLSRSNLVARDQELYSETRADRDLTTIGLDVAGEAVSYAEEVGIINASLTANLESRNPTSDEKELLSPVDLVISTGAIGYVGVPTFSKILDCAETAPWFALFALRMFPVDEIAAMLKARGYSVYRLPGETFLQRRFAGNDEARDVLDRLETLAIDPAGYEAEGWYHAEFFFAWRTDEEGSLPIPGLTRV